MVPTFGVGSAVIGVRMMSHSSKNAPKPREVVLNTACIRARSAKLVCRPCFPDPDVDRLDQIGRRLLQPARGEHVADHDGKIADVAGGLRRKGFAIVQLGQGVVDVMAEAFEEAPDLLQLGRDLRRRAVIAPLVRQRDFQPAPDRA